MGIEKPFYEKPPLPENIEIEEVEDFPSVLHKGILDLEKKSGFVNRLGLSLTLSFPSEEFLQQLPRSLILKAVFLKNPPNSISIDLEGYYQDEQDIEAVILKLKQKEADPSFSLEGLSPRLSTKVFIYNLLYQNSGLASGLLRIYKRDEVGFWGPESPQYVKSNTPFASIKEGELGFYLYAVREAPITKEPFLGLEVRHIVPARLEGEKVIKPESNLLGRAVLKGKIDDPKTAEEKFFPWVLTKITERYNPGSRSISERLMRATSDLLNEIFGVLEGK